ncbi:MAG: JAB domain-containing protein [Clostridia bacterium]|nr:JAB domain-containing protein [Clostridia bacterium]
MDEKILCDLFNSAGFDGKELSSRLIFKFGSLAAALEADENILCEACDSKSAATYLKLAAALAARRVSDRLRFGKQNSEEEILCYFKAIFFALSVETVYVMSLDRLGRPISCEKAGEGTVNGTNVLPRRIVEIAKRAGACSVVLAHNHPSGYAVASDDDIVGSIVLRELLYAAGIKLIAHYVIAGADSVKIDI